ncbi:MAG: TetR family transcriptional regulator [Rhodocyclaceae bacterium]|nr:MAG: TetR family transcriptional regulator [Rhodocyclaceae bacterium]
MRSGWRSWVNSGGWIFGFDCENFIQSWMYVNSALPHFRYRITRMVRKTKEEAELTRRHILDAARRVFLECGVARTTLEKVAAAAGVTRGAVYWHFRNKTDLFFAMREQATLPFVDRVVFDEAEADPLQGIERALREIIHIMEDQPETRETIEILSFKCEYV